MNEPRATPSKEYSLWAKGRIIPHLFFSMLGQLLLIYPGERLTAAALLGLNLMYFVFFFRNVSRAEQLKNLLQDAGDLPEDYEETDDSAPVGSSYPWIFLGFPILYLASFFDEQLLGIVAVAIWIDLFRLSIQTFMVAIVHADLRHKVKMLTEPEYLQKVLVAARKQKEKEGR